MCSKTSSCTRGSGGRQASSSRWRAQAVLPPERGCACACLLRAQDQPAGGEKEGGGDVHVAQRPLLTRDRHAPQTSGGREHHVPRRRESHVHGEGGMLNMNTEVYVL